MLAAAMAEMASLGALLPFLGLLASPDEYAGAGRLQEWLRATLGLDRTALMLAITVTFALIAALAAAVRIALNIALARTNFRTGHEIGSQLYLGALTQPFEFHVRHHSADIIGGVVKVDTAIFVLLAVLIGTSSAFIAACIGLTLLLVNPVVAIVAVLGFGGIYALVSRLTHAHLLVNGKIVNSTTPARLQAMQEGLGSIRDVILDHTQRFHIDRFNEIDRALRRAQESNQILGPTPRYLIEALGMIIIAAFGCWYSLRGGGIAAALPTLGVLVLGGQRLLPLLQQAYQGWVMLAGHLAVLEDVTRLLNESSRAGPLPNTEPVRLSFAREIRFEDVGFRFEGGDRDVFSQVNLSIPAGSRVGIVGPTGGGKSTFLNLAMGLLKPTAGRIAIDGRALDDERRPSWQRNIAHVPQTIFLADATILENVAFGVPRDQIDEALARESIRRAQLQSYVESLKDGALTFVGENGIRLSGGQRQRIGIARALYKEATVLILDEATSALDEQTEAEVMQSVEALDRSVTLIMIAHRLSTLRTCDFLVRVQDGVIVKVHGHLNTQASRTESATP